MFAFDRNLFELPLHRIHMLCKDSGLTIVTAESCTGGLLSALLTHLSGSSSYFRGGVCVYSNDLKTQLLGIPQELLAKHGAVSPEVATGMAQAARTRLSADFSLAVTGIAGPGGGSPEKPVGTVYCAIGSAEETRLLPLCLQGDRTAIRAQTCLAILENLVAVLEQKAPGSQA